MTDQPTTAHESALVQNVTTYVQQYMSQYDGSHDFEHVQRVLGLARHIAAHTAGLDPLVVTLAALLHDVGDRKYVGAGADGERMVQSVLEGFGAGKELAAQIQAIVGAVSYSGEVRDARHVRAVQAQFPELAAVQDADRLDALGAVGVGRAFTYGGAKGRGLGNTIEHFTEKLERLEGMMKTDAGRALARERTGRLVQFKQWWEEEVEAARQGLAMGGDGSS